MMKNTDNTNTTSSERDDMKNIALAESREQLHPPTAPMTDKATNHRSSSSDGVQRETWPLFVPGSSAMDTLQSIAQKAGRRRQGTGDAASSCASRSSCSTGRTSYGSSPSSLTSSSFLTGESSVDELEEAYVRAMLHAQLNNSTISFPSSASEYIRCSQQGTTRANRVSEYDCSFQPGQHDCQSQKSAGASPLLLLSSDMMAHVMGFLEPPEVLGVLTMPLCKEWRQSYTSHQYLWKVMCMEKPFNAKVSDEVFDDTASEDSFCSLSNDSTQNDPFGQYRLMYNSFVRCMKYLKHIKDDTMNGRRAPVIDYASAQFPNFGPSNSLKSFLARAREVINKNASKLNSSAADAPAAPVGVSDDGSSVADCSARDRGKRRQPACDNPMSKKPKFGHSMITARLLGPSSIGEPGKKDLPTSCAIFSIVNWMVTFSEVEGIQTMCVKTLPVLLEDEQQRVAAQRVGVTERVLRAMVLFPDSLDLHTASFHALVLLARPLGGREGMLFDNSMADSSMLGLLGRAGEGRNSANSSVSSKSQSKTPSKLNGIAILLESMRRFQSEGKLQAMACWAMVNIALAPLQKKMLIRLGGIQATINAMAKHRDNADVQFRALFALINLVIPPTKTSEGSNSTCRQVNDCTEKEILDKLIGEISSLVVEAMKNFCSSESILNRACLVLHNLSQNREHLPTLLWTTHCYQMLEWCIANYPSDQVLRRSAVSTLHRLQVALSNDDQLRTRFIESIRTEKQLPLSKAVPGGLRNRQLSHFS